MKAEELANLLLKNPDFDIIFSILEPDGSPYGIGLRRFNIEIDDISYSDKKILIGPLNEIK